MTKGTKMGEEIRKIRLFLSSPGDVEAERGKVPAVAAQVNRMLGDSLGFHLEVVEWKTHVAPDMGGAQEVINRQIRDYDIFLGVMWKRMGTPTEKAKSGTEEEFNVAYANWERFERPRILFYFSQAPYKLEDAEEVSQLAEVIAFKKKMQQKGLVWEYRSAEEFSDTLREHLVRVLQEWFPPTGERRPVADFNRYLSYLKNETMFIDIRGLMSGEGTARRFRIDELYIPLQTTGAGLSRVTEAKKGRKSERKEIAPREIPLQEALKEQRLIIRGDPGTGKTTFLRLIAFTLCRKWLGDEADTASQRILWPDLPPIPILVFLGRMTEHIRKYKSTESAPAQEDSPDWLPHYLEQQSREFNFKLSGEAFRPELEAGRCLILLDGLDEAPELAAREKVSSLAANLLKAFPDCRVVLTSRPAALAGKAIPEAFAMTDIAPLGDEAIGTFITRWSKALHAGAPEKSEAHRKELGEALQSKLEIRRMARTPVMLTALAVVHWNEHRLPEQRAELYESILTWLCRSREQRAGRLKADRCRKLLQKLALAMFTHPEGRQKQAGSGWAAEKLANEFSPTGEETALEQARRFLREEVIDSGIIVERGNSLEYWHLSFQEYLAAYEIAGLLDAERTELLFKSNRLFSSEWREVQLLLGGVLYKQGGEKINDLINAVIERSPKQATQKNLPLLAKTVGLLGGIVHDLSPFDFEPVNPAYPDIVKSVMGIFEKETYKKIPVQTRIEAADTLGQVGDPRLIGDPMVEIPGGRFYMGAQKSDEKGRNYDPEADDDESPVHEVELSTFFISKYPITVGQYRRFIEDGGYAVERYWQAGGFGKFKEPDEWEEQQQFPSRPVVNVSWYEAVAYAAWADGRLPTEAEWERAARGPGEEYRKYPWGYTKPTGETANYGESNIDHVTPVGIFPEDCSPEGVVDMAGNVWEWCENWYDEGRDTRVVRGGAFYVSSEVLRSANRVRNDPVNRNYFRGFRVVRVVES